MKHGRLFILIFLIPNLVFLTCSQSLKIYAQSSSEESTYGNLGQDLSYPYYSHGGSCTSTTTSASVDSGTGTPTGQGTADFIQKITPAPFSGEAITPTGVVLHWTAGSPNTTVEDFIGIIGGRGLSVQLYIDGAGHVYQLVDNLAMHTSHAGDANSKTIGIEIAAGSDGTVETAEREINGNATQARAVARTVAFLVQQFDMQTATDVAGLKGILSHHLVDPGRKSDVGDRYLEKIRNAVETGNFADLGSGGGGSGGDCGGSSGSGGSGGNPEENKRLGEAMAAERGWTGAEWACLLDLWTRESGWNHLAINDAEGNNDLNDNSSLDGNEEISETEHDAYGIPQSLPGGKMKTAGDDWRTNPRTQIKWGLDYIAATYQTPCRAIDHHNANNWY